MARFAKRLLPLHGSVVDLIKANLKRRRGRGKDETVL